MCELYDLYRSVRDCSGQPMLTAENLPVSIFSLTPNYQESYGCARIHGHEIQACLCGLLSLRALQLKISVGALAVKANHKTFAGEQFPTDI